ncbi:hypothetical protein TNCV_3620761 [Trichonephila clavipes]|nr:hypothetical protein TNCV_3620761 [Trichonephila clavipes]
MAQRQNLKRRRITCWGCGGTGHLRSCPSIIKEDHDIKCWACREPGMEEVTAHELIKKIQRKCVATDKDQQMKIERSVRKHPVRRSARIS